MEHPDCVCVSSVPHYITKLDNALQGAFAEAHKQLSIHQERFTNKRVLGQPYYKPGDLIWLFNPVVPCSSFKKFHKPWTGSHRVVEKISDNYRNKNTQRPFIYL